MVVPNHEQYKESVSMLPRTQLEKFALQAAATMESLEQENAQLRMDIDDVKKIDVEVIEGWRTWGQTLDEEREKWADLSTRFSAENQLLNRRIQHVTRVNEALLRAIADIEIVALDRSSEETKPTQLRSGYRKILKMAKDAVDNHKEMNEESEQQENDTADES